MKLISGKQLGLNLIEQAGAIRSHKARPITWHTHAAFELLFMIDGEMSYEFRGHPPVRLSGGSFFIIPPGLKHRGVNSVGTPSSLFGIACRPLAAGAADLTALTPGDLSRIRKLLKTSTLSVHPCGRELKRSVARLFELVERHAGLALETLVQARLRAACCTVLIDAALDLGSTPAQDENAIVAAAKRYLEAHCHTPTRITDLVRHLGFSRARVFDLFKAGTGMTPNDYLLRCRIRKAQELLADPGRPVTDVGLALGFSSSQYFCHVFRKYTGQTPSRYRTQKGRIAGASDSDNT